MSSIFNILGMNRTMDDLEYLRDLAMRIEISEQRKLELSIETAIQMSKQDYQSMAEKGKARLGELIPQYVKAFGHLGLVKFGYFNG